LRSSDYFDYSYAAEEGFIRVVTDAAPDIAMSMDLNPDTVTKEALRTALKLVAQYGIEGVWFDELCPFSQKQDNMGIIVNDSVTKRTASTYLRMLLNRRIKSQIQEIIDEKKAA